MHYIEDELDGVGVDEMVVLLDAWTDMITVVVPAGLVVDGVEVNAVYLNELQSGSSFKRVVEAGLLDEVNVGARLTEYRGALCCGSCRDDWLEQLQDEVEE